jgi:TrmH family RNA methyltransferase
MGAHFGLHLIEGLHPQDVQQLQIPVLTTSSHQGPYLHDLLAQGQLPSLGAWVLGHEGQGVSETLEAQASLHVRIAQPGGEESLNVAAAAAICLHASATALPR